MGLLNEVFHQVLGTPRGNKKSRKKGSKGSTDNYTVYCYYGKPVVTSIKGQLHFQKKRPEPKKKPPQMKMIAKEHFYTDWRGKRHYYKRYY